MRDTLIIGLTGPKTTGKTTTAQALVAEIVKGGLDYTPHILSFSTPIEHALLQMFGLEEAPEDKEAPLYNGHSGWLSNPGDATCRNRRVTIPDGRWFGGSGLNPSPYPIVGLKDLDLIPLSGQLPTGVGGC